MFDRPDAGERVLIVHLQLSHAVSGDLSECKILAESAGATVLGEITGRRDRPDPKFFIGSGKVKEIAEVIEAQSIDLVIFDHPLSPAQERNLERELKCRVLDRAGLILDIFAQRARTHEGKLQVELAQLQHLSTRLVRGWTHLERQKGGIGLRGPGETQLETDRRLLRDRIKMIQRKLEKVRTQRAQSRRLRERAATPTVAFVGYTNAGKSTLFNRLTASDVYAADQLFATLDPTLRRLKLPHLGEVVLADTVGFIRHLPHDLVEAFKATLEEAASADLLVHVVDSSRADFYDMVDTVHEVLKQIGADQVPELMAMNKIDVTGESVHAVRNHTGELAKVWLSAQTGEGIDLLKRTMAERLSAQIVHACVRLAPSEAAVRARLFALGAISQETIAPNGDSLLELRLNSEQWRLVFAGLSR